MFSKHNLKIKILVVHSSHNFCGCNKLYVHNRLTNQAQLQGKHSTMSTLPRGKVKNSPVPVSQAAGVASVTVTVSMPSTSSSSLESNMTLSVRSPAVTGFTVNWHRTSPPTGIVLKEMNELFQKMLSWRCSTTSHMSSSLIDKTRQLQVTALPRCYNSFNI